MEKVKTTLTLTRNELDIVEDALAGYLNDQHMMKYARAEDRQAAIAFFLRVRQLTVPTFGLLDNLPEIVEKEILARLFPPPPKPAAKPKKRKKPAPLHLRQGEAGRVLDAHARPVASIPAPAPAGRKAQVHRPAPGPAMPGVPTPGA